MTELPPGWSMKTLGDVASWGSGGTPPARVSEYYGGDIPWAVIGDLNDGVVSTTRMSITDAGLRNSAAKWFPAGTVLVAMYGSIGKLGIAAGTLTTNQAIAGAVPNAAILQPRFLFYYLMSQRADLAGAGKGAAQQNIGQGMLKSWPVPVPPLGEQQRIIELLDEYLSHLDYAHQALRRVIRGTSSLTRSLLCELIPEPDRYEEGWLHATVADAGKVELGRQRHPDWHFGPNMRPYLRVANVFENRIDASDLMEMHWPDDTFERFKLLPGDVLLNEGQSPQFLGRPALYAGEPADVAFTNSLIRFRARDDVLPEFALLVFRRHMHAGRFMRESRITTNIAHLSASRFKKVEFPIPPVPTQLEIVEAAEKRLAKVERLHAEAAEAMRRQGFLRRSILSAAFAGHFTRLPSNGYRRLEDIEIPQEDLLR